MEERFATFETMSQTTIPTKTLDPSDHIEVRVFRLVSVFQHLPFLIEGGMTVEFNKSLCI